MVNKTGLLFFGVLFLLICAGSVSAAAAINTVTINNTDYFYSNSSSNNLVNIVVNATGTNYGVAGGGYVYANFSGVSAGIDCGSSIGNQIVLTNDTYGRDIFNGTCNVGDEATASNFNLAGPVAILAASAAGPPTATSSSATIILYNMTTPPSPPAQSCTQFGPLTTNFANVLNFASVNFVINIQANFTCLAPPGVVTESVFRDVMVLNLTSVNLSTQAQAQNLSLLQNALNVSLVAPHQHGDARIFINDTMFRSLNTSASIRFFFLPFTRLPAVISDNPAELTGTGFISNGYDSALHISTVNLTINVSGFSGHTIADNETPIITINSPANSTSAVSSYSVDVNGTIMEPSSITITLNGTSYIYNSTYNSANCSGLAGTGNETYRCASAVPALADGTYNLSVQAYDLSGANNNLGNSASNSSIFTQDTVKPLVTVYSPANTTYGIQSITVNVSISEAGYCLYSFNNDANRTMTATTDKMNFNATNASIADGSYTVRIYCNDSNGNVNNTEYKVLTLDTTAPTVTIVSPTNTTYTGNSYVINVTLNEPGYCMYSTDNGTTNSTLSANSNNRAFNTTKTGVANGNYTVRIYCNDSIGNIAGQASRNILINDTTAPFVTINSPTKTTYTTDSYTINFTLNETGSCVYSLDSGAANSTMTTSDSLTFTKSISSAANASYVIRAYCNDTAGNNNNTENKYFVIAKAVTEEESGSSSGGASPASYWTTTYQYPNELSEEGQINKLLIAKNRIRIKVDGETHEVGLVSLTTTQATINISSTPQQAVFNIGDMKTFEVTGDNYYDVNITLNGIASGKANVTIIAVHDKLPSAAAATGAGNVTGNATTGAKTGVGEKIAKITQGIKENSKTAWIIFIVILLAAIAAVYFLILKKRKLRGY